jgi:opacity protein-like surface antigen
MRARLIALLGAGLALAVIPSAGAADIDVGLRGGYYFDVDEPFLGAELLMPVVGRRIFFNPNVEYVFVDGLNYLTLNGDFHYDFPTHGSTYVWAGAGLGLVRLDFEGPNNSDTEAALNLLAGVGFRARNVIPYFQAKVIAKEDSAFVLAFGVRF